MSVTAMLDSMYKPQNSLLIEAAEMRILRPPAGYRRSDRIHSEDIREPSDISFIAETTVAYQRNWQEHMEGIKNDSQKYSAHTLRKENEK
jgi:hypothetical protein